MAARVTLADVEVAVLSDRLLITGRGGSEVSLAFSSVAAEPGVDLEQQLLVRTRRKAATT